jgi:hypothetical protein
MGTQTLWLHRNAPAKPAPGAPCNGCGVCCASEPCPLGMLFSGRRRGRCRMLRFDAAAARYRCGLLQGDTAAAGWRRWVRQALDGLVRRWIGAGQGCDSTAQAMSATH